MENEKIEEIFGEAPLKAKTVPEETILALLSEEAIAVYNNKINSTPESKLRYLQVTFKGEEKEEKFKWLIARFNHLAKYFKGTYSPIGDLDLPQAMVDPLNIEKRGIFFIWLVLKDEFEYLTKEGLNEL